ncbi:hypothetical protein M433DRAFT_348462 [Acidomyces richmondensis BFW]|nr:MAG: hypothetical protein FE78DRAFT_467889 [Acidomyces sp. 'richmondensis']KYG49148.1 hypothetical protein M433DRAFT_348462 [Acidomyces richmondensis BFW]
MPARGDEGKMFVYLGKGLEKVISARREKYDKGQPREQMVRIEGALILIFILFGCGFLGE